MIAKNAVSMFAISIAALVMGCSSTDASEDRSGTTSSALGGDDRCTVHYAGPGGHGEPTVENCPSVEQCILEACAGYSCVGTCNAKPAAKAAAKGRCTVHDSNGPLEGGDLTVEGCSSVEACILEACAGYSCVGDCSDP